MRSAAWAWPLFAFFYCLSTSTVVRASGIGVRPGPSAKITKKEPSKFYRTDYWVAQERPERSTFVFPHHNCAGSCCFWSRAGDDLDNPVGWRSSPPPTPMSGPMYQDSHCGCRRLLGEEWMRVLQDHQPECSRIRSHPARRASRTSARSAGPAIAKRSRRSGFRRRSGLRTHLFAELGRSRSRPNWPGTVHPGASDLGAYCIFREPKSA